MTRHAGFPTPSSSPQRISRNPDSSDNGSRKSSQIYLRRFAGAWECAPADLIAFFGIISVNTVKHLSPLTCYPWEQVRPVLQKYRNQRLAGNTPRGASKTKPWQPIDIEKTISQLRQATVVLKMPFAMRTSY
ncbi:hypothetical protein NM208_g930 [Fusarium decemcellulare]|uniref:Uncharacterized protein n=1 Tax=Fusarium decemcellulare TaxID=57161 RepID=A0ACC1SXV9_9HYPO|nr:hypothetical protein NM208_g930 [Fusarium decemcellulare]